MESSPPLKIEE